MLTVRCLDSNEWRLAQGPFIMVLLYAGGAIRAVCMECGMSKISIGISTGLPENWGRDAGLKNPIGNPRNKH